MTAGESPKDAIAVFAEVQASLSDPFGDRDVTLALRGLDERAWQSIEAAWTARLARNDDAAAELAQAYGEAFEAARRAPGKGREKTMSLAGAMVDVIASPERSTPGRTAREVPPPGLDVAAAFSAPGASASVAAKPLAMPSFLKERPADPPGAPGFAPASPFPATPAVVAPLAPTPTPGYTGTAAVDLAAIFKSAVPFDPSARGSVPASPAHAATKARPPALAQSTSKDKAPPREAARSPSPLSKSALSGETADVDIGAIARQVLGFGAARSGSAPSSTNPTFTLDQYAQLSAEIALDADPAARAAVFARYGVGSADALTTEWRARFSADPALAGRWSAAYAHHYARLMAERGPRR